MKLYYTVKVDIVYKEIIFHKYENCCVDNLAAVLDGRMKPNNYFQVINPIVYFHDTEINNCPFCGAEIEFIKE